MATAGNFSRTIESGHEAYYEFPCSLCGGEGKHTESIKYCEECFVYMCDLCVTNHDKFPLHKRHRLLDKSQFTTVNKTALISYPTTHCSKHPGELVNIYCGEHDVVCCSVCKALEHGACVNTVHLPDAAKGVKTSNEYGSIKKYIKSLISNVDKVLNDRKADISRIKDHKQHVKQTIADWRKKINKYVDGLEKNSLDVLEVKEKAIMENIDKDRKNLEKTRRKAEEILKELESFKGDNECDLFVHVKAGNHFIEYAVQALSVISKTETIRSIHFEMDKGFEEYLVSLNALGSFSSKTAHKGNISPVSKVTPSDQTAQKQPSTRFQQDDNIMPQFTGRFDVTENSDTMTCRVHSICQLQDGTLLITDWNNKKLKRIGQSFKVQDSVTFSSEPDCVCAAGPGEVAVSVCGEKKVQFVSVGQTLNPTRSFTMSNYCRGIVCFDSKLFVCCGTLILTDSSAGSIEVYNMAGQLQRSIAHTSGSLPSVPVTITACDDRQHLFVTSWKNESVIMLDLVGNVVNSFSHIDMKGLNCVYADCEGHVFACGRTSNTVVQLSPKHQKVDVILSEEDGIKRPLTVCFDEKGSKLIVSCQESNQLVVYSMK